MENVQFIKALGMMLNELTDLAKENEASIMVVATQKVDKKNCMSLYMVGGNKEALKECVTNIAYNPAYPEKSRDVLISLAEEIINNRPMTGEVGLMKVSINQN